MKRFIVLNNKTAINIDAIVNFKEYSSTGTYIDFYAYDSEQNSSFKIDRVETNLSFDDICARICESNYNQ